MGFLRPCSYPDQYKGPLEIESQIEIIAKAFGLDPRPALAMANRHMNVPEQAEGLFAIPRVDKVGQDYTDAVRWAQSAINNMHELHIGGRDFDSEYLEQSPRSELVFLAFVERCPESDIFLVPAQFGKAHAGKPVDSVRRAADSSRVEFGMGLFGVLCMLLTHPLRLASERALAIDVPGDLYFPFNRRSAYHAPIVDRNGNKIVIATAPIIAADPNSGSVTGFLV